MASNGLPYLGPFLLGSCFPSALFPLVVVCHPMILSVVMGYHFCVPHAYVQAPREGKDSSLLKRKVGAGSMLAKTTDQNFLSAFLLTYRCDFTREPWKHSISFHNIYVSATSQNFDTSNPILYTLQTLYVTERVSCCTTAAIRDSRRRRRIGYTRSL